MVCQIARGPAHTIESLPTKITTSTRSILRSGERFPNFAALPVHLDLVQLVMLAPHVLGFEVQLVVLVLDVLVAVLVFDVSRKVAGRAIRALESLFTKVAESC